MGSKKLESTREKCNKILFEKIVVPNKFPDYLLKVNSILTSDF